MRYCLLTFALSIAAACGEVSTPTIDAAEGPDAALPDAAEPDALVPDAFIPDAFIPDAFVPDAAPMRTITVVVGGNGTGTVTSVPAGLSCPGTCTITVPDGATLTLTATAQGTSSFLGWSGGPCSGTTACTFTATADVAVNASFGQNFSLIVTKTGTGSGAVTSSPSGIACGTDCDETYAANTMVTLTATSSLDSTFSGWSGGGCAGTGTCTVTISGAVAVNATFTLRQFTLTTATGGTGGGTVTGTGISCGADCTEAYPFGTVVPLTATADATSTFTGWSGGGCSGTGTCSVTMDADRNVTALFTRNQVTLTVVRAGTGAGTVTSSPAGISCGADCTETYNQNTTVTLTAVTAAGSTFTGWSGGGCTGTGACNVTLAAATTVTATFTLNTYTLTVARAGTGTGTVTSSPAGISCGADCTEVYGHGTTVTLTAAAAVGSTFTGWSGGGCTGTGACTATITAATTITATFTLNQYTLTVTKAGLGTGTVTSSPAGISCGADCSELVNHGTAVTLTATPTSGHSFSGWSGGGCTGTGTCAVTMTAATTVTATFVPPPNIVFVTSTATHTGSLGGLAGADSICQARASAAGLAGTYRAYLSSSTVNAISRLGTASGWVRRDGKPVVNTPADLAAGRVFHPIRITETGADAQNADVMTASNSDGTLSTSGTTCSDFTAADSQSVRAGFADGVASMFSTFTTSSCSSQRRLYCFGVSNTSSVSVTPPASYRRAFITSASWTPGGGLAGADALCTSEATSAGLPGTYRALLATASASAASRFSTSGAPWARTDGVLLASTAAGLFSATFWETGLNVLANGTYMNSGNTAVWGGGTSLSTNGTAALTCGGTWSSTAGTGGSGRNGHSRVADLFAYDSTNVCTATHVKLACLQQ